MTSTSLHYFIYNNNAAKNLAMHLNIPAHSIRQHTFPDGESKIQITPSSGTVILYASLNRPNDKLLMLAFTVSALRENGAERIVLVAPYMCYMRQDVAFEPGEAVSQRVVGGFLASLFDRIICVDPHLHRINGLNEVFPNCQTDSLLATTPIAEYLTSNIVEKPTILVGPDAESRQWVSAIADKSGLPFIVGEKIRRGDRDISFTLPQNKNLKGARAVIVDDMLSSGSTIISCALALTKAGVVNIDVVTTHALCSAEDLELIYKAGVSSVSSCDSVEHPTNAIELTTMLAKSLTKELI